MKEEMQSKVFFKEKAVGILKQIENYEKQIIKDDSLDDVLFVSSFDMLPANGCLRTSYVIESYDEHNNLTISAYRWIDNTYIKQE